MTVETQGVAPGSKVKATTCLTRSHPIRGVCSVGFPRSAWVAGLPGVV